MSFNYVNRFRGINKTQCNVFLIMFIIPATATNKETNTIATYFAKQRVL